MDAWLRKTLASLSIILTMDLDCIDYLNRNARERGRARTFDVTDLRCGYCRLSAGDAETRLGQAMGGDDAVTVDDEPELGHAERMLELADFAGEDAQGDTQRDHSREREMPASEMESERAETGGGERMGDADLDIGSGRRWQRREEPNESETTEEPRQGEVAEDPNQGEIAESQ